MQKLHSPARLSQRVDLSDCFSNHIAQTENTGFSVEYRKLDFIVCK